MVLHRVSFTKIFAQEWTHKKFRSSIQNILIDELRFAEVCNILQKVLAG